MTDPEIKRLIEIEKLVTEQPKRSMVSRQGSLRNDFKLESADHVEKFKAFIRVSEELSDSFSIGLDYVDPEGGNICLLRCNGKHGEHKNHNTGETFFDFHIHKASEEAIENGESPEQYAEITTEYATWQDALAYFLNAINARDAFQYFSFIQQGNLFDRMGGEKLIL